MDDEWSYVDPESWLDPELYQVLDDIGWHNVDADNNIQKLLNDKEFLSQHTRTATSLLRWGYDHGWLDGFRYSHTNDMAMALPFSLNQGLFLSYYSKSYLKGSSVTYLGSLWNWDDQLSEYIIDDPEFITCMTAWPFRVYELMFLNDHHDQESFKYRLQHGTFANTMTLTETYDRIQGCRERFGSIESMARVLSIIEPFHRFIEPSHGAYYDSHYFKILEALTPILDTGISLESPEYEMLNFISVGNIVYDENTYKPIERSDTLETMLESPDYWSRMMTAAKEAVNMPLIVVYNNLMMGDYYSI
jgi:hypothetical protein